jgi:myo-inositol-1(or 4)-monophosphatase
MAPSTFAHGIPLLLSASQQLLKMKSSTACVYQPMTQELFWAEKGKGAFLNGVAMHVTTNKSLDEAILATWLSLQCPRRSASLHRNFC